jgi:DNA-binding NtrC family response regulator
MNQPPEVLIVDDDPEIRRILASALHPAYSVRLASCGEDAMAQSELLKPDLVLLDLMLPQMGGLAVLRGLKRMSEEILVIMMSAYGQIQTAVQAIKLGAADYFEKPFDREKLLAEMAKILAARILKKLPAREKIIGQSRAIQRVWRLVEQFGPTDIPILLQGETGTGKELFAQALHQISKRSSGPLVPIDCGTLPEQLAESELFGYEEGAFTGAAKKKPGKVTWANGGTLFLDEIGVLSLACQAKLLRLVEQQGFVPLGARDGRLTRLDVRFISATNTPLRKAIEKGGFREDLYQRLSGLTIELPPLRERDGDLELLSRYFLDQYRRQNKKPDLEISEDCLDIFRSYAWPGNVRELQRVIASTVVMADRMILPEHLPSHLPARRGAGSLGRPDLTLCPSSELAQPLDLKRVKEWAGREAQMHIIVELQKRGRMTRQELARFLGVDPKTLRARLKEMAAQAKSSE